MSVIHIDGSPFDEKGNPLVPVGCPNCGRGKGHVDYIGFAAHMNSGRDLAGPCSRRCELQLEHAKSLQSDARGCASSPNGMGAGDTTMNT